MSKKRVVVFYHGGGAKIYTNPDSLLIATLKTLGKVLINPKIPDEVQKISPEFWTYKNSKIGASKKLASIKDTAIKTYNVAKGIFKLFIAFMVVLIFIVEFNNIKMFLTTSYHKLALKTSILLEFVNSSENVKTMFNNLF